MGAGDLEHSLGVSALLPHTGVLWLAPKGLRAWGHCPEQDSDRETAQAGTSGLRSQAEGRGFRSTGRTCFAWFAFCFRQSEQLLIKT